MRFLCVFHSEIGRRAYLCVLSFQRFPMGTHPLTDTIRFVSLNRKQLAEQIQNLTVSSTTSTSGNQQSATGTSKPSASVATDKSTQNPANSAKDTASTVAASNEPSAKENLEQRVKFLQTKLANAPMPSITSKRRQLPSIEEAWNLPISAEMSSRQQQSAQNNQQRAFVKGFNQVRVEPAFSDAYFLIALKNLF